MLAPERVEKLVLCCTTPGGPDAFPLPEGTLKLLAEAPTLAPEVALRRFVENALGASPPEALVDEIFALRVANPPDPAGWQAQAAAGATFSGVEGSIDAPTLILHGTDDKVVDVRNAELLAERIPGARGRGRPRRRAPVLLGAARTRSSRPSWSSSREHVHPRSLDPRPRAQHARRASRSNSRAPRRRTPTSIAAPTSLPPACPTATSSPRSPPTPSSTSRSSSRARSRVRSCTRSPGGLRPPRSPISSTMPAPSLFLATDEHGDLARGGARARDQRSRHRSRGAEQFVPAAPPTATGCC